MQEATFYGKLPVEQERAVVEGLMDNLNEFFSRTFMPFLLFEREVAKKNLTEAKKRLEMLV
jgi:hypothetical protein